MNRGAFAWLQPKSAARNGRLPKANQVTIENLVTPSNKKNSQAPAEFAEVRKVSTHIQEFMAESGNIQVAIREAVPDGPASVISCETRVPRGAAFKNLACCRALSQMAAAQRP